MFKRILLAAALMLASSGAASADGASNLQIFRAVQSQVLGYTHFTIFDNVHVKVDNGAVRLIGKVTMPYKRDDLERRVRAVPGVERVENQIQVLPVSRFDDDLRLGIAQAIYSNPAFRPFAATANPPIHIIVENGHVTLDGVVLTDVDRAIARSIASGFLSHSFTNELKTEAEVREALEQF